MISIVVHSKFTKDERSSLFSSAFSDEGKRLITLTPGANVINLFWSLICGFFTKLDCLKNQAGKACQGQTLKLIKKIHKLRSKKFYSIGSRAKCYKYFYARNLRIFILSHSIFKNRLEKLVTDKHSKLLQKFINYRQKSLIKLAPGFISTGL